LSISAFNPKLKLEAGKERIMCDYSLMAVPNRLAHEGEDLVTHRFPTGSLGLASPADITRVATPVPATQKTFWMKLKEFFQPPEEVPVAAVCIPPGARLRLEDIPARLQKEIGVGPVEEVTFTQITAAAHSYRDAVRFCNGREVRLQELREGQRARVLDLSMAQELDLDALARELEEFSIRSHVGNRT
jgi:hypothetical protein